MFVTSGVVLTTLSASKPKTAKPADFIAATSGGNTYTYATGILILLLALVLSGLLGIAQDRTYALYGSHSNSKAPSKPENGSTPASAENKKEQKKPAIWQEQMFYLHFLSMPMFYSVRQDLFDQFQALGDGPVLYLALPASNSLSQTSWHSYSSIPIPAAYLYLLLNTLTQLVCISGVHRLTSRVSSLTVTLVLVVRKAVSLIISVTLFGSGVEGNKAVMMWIGAMLVFLGTFVYSFGGSKVEAKKKQE